MLSFIDRVSTRRSVCSRARRRFSPKGYAERIRVLMLRAGRTAPGAADRFLAIRALTVLGAPVVFFLAYTVTASLGSIRLMAAGLVRRRVSCSR